MIQTLSVLYYNQNEKIAVGKLAYKEGVIYFEYTKEFLALNLQLSPYKGPKPTKVLKCP